jgi:hypothetical protein
MTPVSRLAKAFAYLDGVLPARLVDELVLLRPYGDLALDWNRVEGNWLLTKGKSRSNGAS